MKYEDKHHARFDKNHVRCLHDLDTIQVKKLPDLSSKICQDPFQESYKVFSYILIVVKYI